MTTGQALRALACVAYVLCAVCNGEQPILCVPHDGHIALELAHRECCEKRSPHNSAAEQGCDCCVDIPFPLPAADPHVGAARPQVPEAYPAWAEAFAAGPAIEEQGPAGRATGPPPLPPSLASLRTVVLLR